MPPFDDWTFSGLTAQRTGDSASFTRADAEADLLANVARYEAPFAAEAERCALEQRLDEEARVAAGTAVNGAPRWMP